MDWQPLCQGSVCGPVSCGEEMMGNWVKIMYTNDLSWGPMHWIVSFRRKYEQIIVNLKALVYMIKRVIKYWGRINYIKLADWAHLSTLNCMQWNLRKHTCNTENNNTIQQCWKTTATIENQVRIFRKIWRERERAK